jgi:vesicle transport protein SEC22
LGRDAANPRCLLSSVAELDDQAAALRAKSKLYLKEAKQLSWQAFYQKYGPLAAVALVILVFLYWRFFL